MIKLIFLSLVIFAPLHAIESYIEFKVNNEIVTNLDIETEYRYLIALNNELENIDKKTILELAKESVIREKIKKNELLNYYEFDSTKKYLDVIVKNFYEKINIKSLEDFEAYLNRRDLELLSVKNKIEIEMLWNKLIGTKYEDQLNIKEEILRQKIAKNTQTNGFLTEYELSEIIFQITNENDLNNKLNLIKKDITERGFKNAANIHSIADSSKFGGDIGWVDEKQLTPEITAVLEKLKIGDISEPFNISNSLMILKIKNKKQKIIEVNKEKLLAQAIQYETIKQYNQFSIIYYNKIKLNSILSEQ